MFVLGTGWQVTVSRFLLVDSVPDLPLWCVAGSSFQQAKCWAYKIPQAGTWVAALSQASCGMFCNISVHQAWGTSVPL
jgi:hypothetical protein